MTAVTGFRQWRVRTNDWSSLSAFGAKNGIVAVFVLLLVALSSMVQASPSTPPNAATLTVRLDDSGVPLFGAVCHAAAVAVQVRVMNRDELVKVVRKPYRAQVAGIKLIRLTGIPVGAIRVVLEGLDRKGEVVAFSVQDVVLSSKESTVTFTPPIPEVEGLEDLGFGFRIVSLMKPVQTDFESVGHFGYLYHGDQRICQLGECSVSPSGSYVIVSPGVRQTPAFQAEASA